MFSPLKRVSKVNGIECSMNVTHNELHEDSNIAGIKTSEPLSTNGARRRSWLRIAANRILWRWLRERRARFWERREPASRSHRNCSIQFYLTRSGIPPDECPARHRRMD